MLNYIQSCHLEPIVLPGCWQTSAQCVDCILPFSFLICFSSPFLRVTQHNHSELFIISPVISLFFFCGKALIKHLIACTSQKCVILKHKKACNYSQRTCPSSPLQLQKRGHYSKHVLLLPLFCMLP